MSNTNENISDLKKQIALLEASVNEMRVLRDALKESEERYRMAFEYTGTAMMVLDEDMTITMGNHKTEEITGYTQDEIVKKKKWPEYVGNPDDLAKMTRFFQERSINPSSAPTEYEFQLKTSNGSLRDILINVSMIPGTKKRLISLLDITERKAAETAKLKQAAETAEEAKSLVRKLTRELTIQSTFADMVSRSPQMKQIFNIVPEIAATPATVLILGESGTGKERIARALHEQGPRSTRPFVAINCSALPDTLLESELFGYKAGAFTDAKKDKPGKFALADKGTMFLDEIGDIPAAMQAKLLRVLQEKSYEPLGATIPITADVRIIAATNKDLSAMVKNGTFREDLFYRINVVTITLPPLRERRCDIPLLCDHFISRFNSRYNKSIAGVNSAALDLLLKHDFPGNIRELENIIEHAFIFCKDQTIGCNHLPDSLKTAPASPISNLGAIGSFDELEKMYLTAVLTETDNNQIEAAKRLNIHKTTLFRKIKYHGISLPHSKS